MIMVSSVPGKYACSSPSLILKHTLAHTMLVSVMILLALIHFFFAMAHLHPVSVSGKLNKGFICTCSCGQLILATHAGPRFDGNLPFGAQPVCHSDCDSFDHDGSL